MNGVRGTSCIYTSRGHNLSRGSQLDSLPCVRGRAGSGSSVSAQTEFGQHPKGRTPTLPSPRPQTARTGEGTAAFAPPKKLNLCPLAVYVLLAVFAAGARVETPPFPLGVDAFRVSTPRPFGHVIGDLIRQRIDLTLHEPFVLAPGSVPHPRRLSYWLDGRRVRPGHSPHSCAIPAASTTRSAP